MRVMDSSTQSRAHFCNISMYQVTEMLRELKNKLSRVTGDVALPYLYFSDKAG